MNKSVSYFAKSYVHLAVCPLFVIASWHQTGHMGPGIWAFSTATAPRMYTPFITSHCGTGPGMGLSATSRMCARSLSSHIMAPDQAQTSCGSSPATSYYRQRLTTVCLPLSHPIHVTILGLVGPLFLFPSRPLSLLTHLGPLPSDSH